MKRRDFIHSLSHAVALPALFSSNPVFAMMQDKRTMLSNTINAGNILILVVLEGGNDGLNTVIPLNKTSQLHNIRPNVVLPDNKILNLNKNSLGLHPSLTGFQELSNQDRLKIVQSVGYNKPNYSHFRSMDIIQSGSASNEYINSGWVARFLESKHSDFPMTYPSKEFPDPLAIELSWSSSLMFTGDRSFTSVVSQDPGNFYQIANEFSNQYPSTPVGEKLTYLQLIAKQSNEYGYRLQSAYNTGKEFSGIFKNNNLGNKFQKIAKLISGGCNTRIYRVSIGGFDTHGDQVDRSDHSKGNHAELLKELDDAVFSFMQAMDEIKASDRVTGMIFSEFGRTVHSNGTYGTDHGSVSPVIFFGNKLDTNVVGTNPDLPNQVSNQYEMDLQFEFRQLYSSILYQWLGSTDENNQKILNGSFDNIQIIKKSLVDSDEDGVPNDFDECDSTPLGTVIGLDGCELPLPPANNLRVIAKGMSCKGEVNGSITLGIISRKYTYNIAVSGPNNFNQTTQINPGDSDLVLNNLELGNYRIISQMVEYPDFQEIFEVTISEPDNLIVTTSLNENEKTLNMIVTGSENYTVQINSEKYELEGVNNLITLPTGLVNIKVSSPYPCQGVYQKTLFISENVKLFPNPTFGPLNIYIEGQDTEVNFKWVDLNGRILEESIESVPFSRLIEKDLNTFSVGTYILEIEGNSIRKSLKIMKR